MNLDPQIANLLPLVQSATQDVGSNAIDAISTSIDSESHERWTKLPKARGRQPKNPHAQSVRFPCREVQDLERQLREYLQAPTAPAVHATLEFVFPISSAFSVYTADIKNKRNTQQDEKSQHLYGKLDRSAISVIDALAQSLDPKDQMRRQKAIAKVCVEACERADGFRYSFHNNWLSREDEACRFSYFCNDSTLNKGRAANEGVNTVGKKMRKASLQLHYKHVPLHKTYAERAPLPRKDSKRYKLMEIFEPEKLPIEPVKRTKSQPPVEIPAKNRPRKKRAIKRLVDNDVTLEEQYRSDAEHNEFDEPRTTNRTGQDASSASAHSRTVADSHVQVIRSPPTPASRRGNSARQGIHALPQDDNAAASGLTWIPIDQPGATSQPRNQAQSNNRESTPQQNKSSTQGGKSAGISISDFEALKAKLEAAEQRIRNLEAEKQTIPPHHQPPVWGPYHVAPQYGYQYPPPFPYPATATMNPAFPANANTEIVGSASADHVTEPSISSSPAIANPVQQTSHVSSTDALQHREIQHTRKPSSFKGFVAYTPKPQRPVLDAQRQDA